MVEKRIRVDELLTPTRAVFDVTLVVKDGVVTKIVDSAANADLDLRGFLVAPGLVDTHIHGCCGVDATTAGGVGDIVKLSSSLVKFGVTSFIPTLVSASHGVTMSALGLLARSRNEAAGAKIMGMGMEGPYINPKRKGAQDPSAIRAADVDEFRQYVDASQGRLALIHVAPEVPGALELIQEAALRGVRVSIGHTDADYGLTAKAIALGASRATHLFDAMKGIHHRDTGAAMALLDDDSVYLELITDLIHLRPETILFALNHARPSRVVLITDGIAAAGLGNGEYDLGKLRVSVKDGRATLSDGTLAGSVLTLDQAVRNVISLGIKPMDAIAMATSTPAASLGFANIGCLHAGCAADMVALDDKYRVNATLVDGDVKYELR